MGKFDNKTEILPVQSIICLRFASKEAKEELLENTDMHISTEDF